MLMYVGGAWSGSPRTTEILNPLTGDVVDTVPSALPEHVERALASAVIGAAQMRALSAYERVAILGRAADLLQANAEDVARTIVLEEGKPITEARGEAQRTPDIFRLAASEAARAHGETLPLDAAPGGASKFGFTLRQPCGVVVAITPFNYPLLLVAHKVAPALAAGNAVILKPASKTPLTALTLTRILLEAGLPELGLQCITGAGDVVGLALCSDARVRRVSFTGSAGVGEAITRVTGVKRLSLELGSNAPLVILPDADLDLVAQATAVGGYVNAGQVCISVQRVLAHRAVYEEVLERLKLEVERIRIGDPLDAETRLSALATRRDAERVERVIGEAVDGGARLVTGGERDGSVVRPAVLAEVTPTMAVYREELFGPAVAVTPVDDVAQAIEMANDSRYGLSAGIFTRDVGAALRFARHVDCGNIMVNWTPLWRADLMPYGGLKASGIGKEGPRYAVEDMTELKTVVFHDVA